MIELSMQTPIGNQIRIFAHLVLNLQLCTFGIPNQRFKPGCAKSRT